jgi:hypothetical protein
LASKIAKKARQKTPRQIEQEARYAAALAEMRGEDRRAPVGAPEPSLPVALPLEVPKAVLDDGMVPLDLSLLRDKERFRKVMPAMAAAFDDLKAAFPDMRVLEIKVPAARASQTRRALGGEA